jgi:pimeloyl-ACP methyl ester carboxylesterase
MLSRTPLLRRRSRRLAAAAFLAVAALPSATTAATTEHVRVASGRDTLAVTVTRPAPGNHPTVVVAPGLGTLYEGNPAKFGARFVDAGYTVVGFDYRHFGDSTGSPRRLYDPKIQLADWRAVIAALPRIAGVDASNVALWGTSMAGGHVLNLAPEYPRLKAVLAQVPHLDSSIGASQRTPLQLAGLAQKITADLLNASLGRPPVTIPFIGAPGSLAMMTAPGSLEYLARVLAEPGTRYVNSTPARSALNILGYSPIKRAANSTVPTFIGAAAGDQLAPAAPARNLANRMRAEYLEVAGGHFDVYSGAPFETLVAAEIAFLRTHMPPA